MLSSWSNSASWPTGLLWCHYLIWFDLIDLWLIGAVWDLRQEKLGESWWWLLGVDKKAMLFSESLLFSPIHEEPTILDFANGRVLILQRAKSSSTEDTSVPLKIKLRLPVGHITFLKRKCWLRRSVLPVRKREGVFCHIMGVRKSKRRTQRLLLLPTLPAGGTLHFIGCSSTWFLHLGHDFPYFPFIGRQTNSSRAGKESTLFAAELATRRKLLST